MTESLLASDEREVQRYELFKLCGTLATHPNEIGGGYAIAFVLFDVVGQLAELNRNLSGIRSVIDDIVSAIDAKSVE
jgi:phosphatidylglycerophosphatase A